MNNNYFSKILITVGLILWLGLGMIILYFQENQNIVLTWASTAGIMFILILGLETRERKNVSLGIKEEEQKQCDHSNGERDLDGQCNCCGKCVFSENQE